MNIINYFNRIDRDDISIHLPENFISSKEEYNNPVLLISHELSRTGAPIQLLELAKALYALGYQPFVYSLSEGDLIYDYININVPVICQLGSVPSADWINRLVDDYNIIFVNTLLLASYVRYLSTRSKRIFWWIHESSFYFKEQYCTDIPKSENINILAASEITGTYITKYMKRNSSSLNVCVEDYLLSENSSFEKSVFLWSGFLDYNKAPDILFEAILKLPSEYLEKSEFFVIGQSHSNNEYADLVKLISSRLPNIHFMDAINHDEFLKLMNKVSSVVITSIEESTSLVAVEGLMMKKVVICSNGCGISRYIKNHEDGFIFPVRASDKLLEIIKYVIDNNKKLDMIRQHGRIIYENNYSFEIFKKRLKMLLNGITC